MSLIDLNALGLRMDSEAQPSTREDPAAPRREPCTSPRTRDHLVELHVLAEHGDDAAAAAASAWLNDDPEARRIWHQVEAQCQELRADATSPASPRPGDRVPDRHEHRNVAGHSVAGP